MGLTWYARHVEKDHGQHMYSCRSDSMKIVAGPGTGGGGTLNKWVNLEHT